MTDGPDADAAGEPGTAPAAAPFFIVGSERSGTTLLRIFLNAHSRIAIPSESWFLVKLMADVPLDRPLSGQEIRSVLDTVRRDKRWRLDWRSDPADLLALASVDAPRTLAELVAAIYRLEIAPSGKPRWGDKSPVYVFHIRELLRLFPSARFLHIVRDGRDVALSGLALRWGNLGRTPLAIGRRWRDAVLAADDALDELGAERVMHVPYEDLVLDTRGTLTRACAFLGIDFEPDMLNANATANQHLSPRELKRNIHAKLRRTPRPDDVQRWKRTRPTLGLLLTWAWLTPGLERFGYEQPRPPLPVNLLRAASSIHHNLVRLRNLARRAVRATGRRIRSLAKTE